MLTDEEIKDAIARLDKDILDLQHGDPTNKLSRPRDSNLKAIMLLKIQEKNRLENLIKQ